MGLGDLFLCDVVLSRLRVHVAPILRDVLQAALFFVIAMGVLRKSGVDVLSLVTTSAVLTAVIGLALQDTLGNLLSGVAMQLESSIQKRRR